VALQPQLYGKNDRWLPEHRSSISPNNILLLNQHSTSDWDTRLEYDNHFDSGSRDSLDTLWVLVMRSWAWDVVKYFERLTLKEIYSGVSIGLKVTDVNHRTALACNGMVT